MTYDAEDGPDRPRPSTRLLRRAVRSSGARRARAELPLRLCLMLLTALLALVAAAGPAVVDGLAGGALATRLEETQLSAPGIEFSVSFGQVGDGQPPEGTLTDDLAGTRDLLMAAAPPPLAGHLVHDSTRVEVPAGTAPVGKGAATFTLLLPDDAPAPRTYAQGRPPSATRGDLEIAVSTRTRDTLGLRLGQQLALTAAPGAKQVDGAARVVGFFAPRDTRLQREVPLLATPLRTSADKAPPAWRAVAVVGPLAVEQIQERRDFVLLAVWRLRLRLDDATATSNATGAGRAALRRSIETHGDDAQQQFCSTQVPSGGFDCALGRHPAGELKNTGPLLQALDRFDQDWARARVLIAFGPASLFCVGLCACAAASLLALRRRLPELRLRRARGASATRLALDAAAETAPPALLGGAAGYALAHLCVPEGAPPPGVLTALCLVLAVWLMLPALTRYALRDGALHAPARTRTRRAHGAAGLRLTAEAAFLLLTAAGVYSLRSRVPATEPDLLLALVPALLGGTAVILLVRCYPPPVRAAARRSARLKGTVPLVALSRAAQDAPSRALALLVLVTTLATAVFGGLVARTLSDGRLDAARWHAGADASYVAESLDADTVRMLSAVPGVRHRVSARHRTADLQDSRDGAGAGTVDLVSVDAAALRAAAPGSAVGRALAGVRAADGAEVPVLAGPELRRGGVYLARMRGADARVRVVGPLPSDAARDDALGPLREDSAAPLLLADEAALGTLRPPTARKAGLLLYGPHIDSRALRALVPRAGDSSAVGRLRILADEEAAVGDDGVLAALTTAYRWCTAVTVLLALLALVLDLLLSAPERGRTAARLRTMGLGDRATGALHLVQLLPMVLAAAIGGSALGLLLPGLLGSALDLRGFTGGPFAPALRTDYAASAVLGAGFLLLVAVAVAVETAMARRRGLTAVLRLGEQP